MVSTKGSGTRGYEAAAQMKALGIGVSTSVGIGGGDQRIELPRHSGTVRGRSGNRCCDDDRRDRRAAGGRRLCPRPYEKASRGLYSRPVCAEGAQDGACGGNCFGLWRKRAGKGRDPQRSRHHRGAEPLGYGGHDVGGSGAAQGGLAGRHYGMERMGRQEEFPAVSLETPAQQQHDPSRCGDSGASSTTQAGSADRTLCGRVSPVRCAPCSQGF